MPSRRLVHLWLILAPACAAWAAESDTDSYRIPDVVVSATRSPESLAKIPAAATVLTREQIERTPFREGHQADDLLRYVPDVQPSNLSSRYNHPTAQAVSLRGLGNRRALVLLDGVPLNDGFGGWINWGMVPNTIERIEIVPGGSSSLYGTWAMGGVIHLITEKPGAGTGVRVESRAGNLNTYSNSLSARYGTNRLGVSVGARWFHTNGFITVPEYQRGAVDRTDDSRHLNLHGTVTAAVDPRTMLSVAGNLFREDRTFGTALDLATRTIGRVTAGLDGDTARGDQWSAKFFAQWQTFRNATGQVTPSPLNRQAEFRDRQQEIPSDDYGGMAQWTLRADARNKIVLGADTRAILAQSGEDTFSLTGITGHTTARGKQLGGGVFGEWIATPTDRLTLIPGFRADWWKNFDGRITSAAGATVPRDNVETALNPKFAAQYAVTERLRAGASFYQAFRAPTLNELYRGFSSSGFSFLANENLTPERLIGGDVKLEADLLPDRRLTLRLTGHHDEVKDQILFVTENALAARRRNVGRTRTRGGGVELTAQPHGLVSLKLGYAYADAIVTSFPGNPSREGLRVPNVSRHQVTLGVTLGSPETVQLTVMGRYLSKQYADDLNTQAIADFVVADASLQKHLGRHWRLTLDAENLTNKSYIATQTGPVKTLGAPLLIMGGVRFEY
ncbi:MAG TPA: TonB-dependent receptor [Nitrospiraceae bacterium]